VLGLIAVLLLLVKPVHADFGDDPLLRLQTFDRAPGALPTDVNCGSVPSSLRGVSPASIYTIARDNACHDAGYRRLMAAAAAAGVLVVLTGVYLVATTDSGEEGSGIWPAGAATRRAVPRPAPSEDVRRPSPPAKPRTKGPRPAPLTVASEAAALRVDALHADDGFDQSAVAADQPDQSQQGHEGGVEEGPERASSEGPPQHHAGRSRLKGKKRSKPSVAEGAAEAGARTDRD